MEYEFETQIKEPKICCSTRTVLWYLVFFGFAVNYMLRVNLNIALVSMVRPKVGSSPFRGACDEYSDIISVNDSIDDTRAVNTEPTVLVADESILNRTNMTSTTPNLDDDSSTNQRFFDWNEKEQGYLLGSFFWLNWLTQLPGGVLAVKYGTKKVFGWSNFIAAFACYLTPWFAHRGIWWLIFIRLFQGFVGGFTWPSMHNMASKWIPPNERSKFVTAYIGSSVGAALTYPICGWIIDTWNWEMVFYVSGVIGTIWFMLWWFLVYDSPEEHPRISMEEKKYIINSIGNTLSKNKLPTPWKSILTYIPFWSAIIGQVGGVWGLFTVTTGIPLYFKFIQGWDIKAIGMLSGVPHLSRIIFSYLFSIFGDFLLKKEKMGRTNVRKLATFFSCGVQGIFMLGLAYSGCNKVAAIICVILATSVQGTVSTGPLAILVDMSPNYSSILMGICNIFIGMTGFCTPAMVGFFTYQNQTIGQWQKVFWVVSFVLFASCIIFLVFSTADIATWNTPDTGKRKSQNKDETVALRTSKSRKDKHQQNEIEKMMYNADAL